LLLVDLAYLASLENLNLNKFNHFAFEPQNIFISIEISPDTKISKSPFSQTNLEKKV